MSTLVEQPLTVNTYQTNAPLNYEVYLKPTPEKEYYRFRLLWFNDNTDRNTPFIERFVHTVWTKNGDKNVVHSISCPTTAHIKKNWPGNPFDDCPLCRFANNNYVVMKESNYKDQTAKDNHKTFKRRFQAIVPVYVVSDPMYDANNGKFKVFTFDDQDIYDKFKKLVIERGATAKVLNGTNALDFLVRADNVPKVLRAGTPEQVDYTKKEIVQMGFSSKPYDIPAITPEKIDEFPFGQLYYHSPSLEELKAFYKEFCLHSVNDDIDTASMATVSKASPVESTKAKPATPKVEPTAKAKVTPKSEAIESASVTPPADDDSFIDEVPNTSVASTVSAAEDGDEGPINIDDLLNDVGV